MGIINFKNLAKNQLRQKALLIVEAGYNALDIEKVIKKKLGIRNEKLEIVASDGRKKYRIELNKFNRIFLVGIGKGSTLASVTLAKILGKRLTSGIALDVQKFKIPACAEASAGRQNSKFKILVGTHPLPSQKNIKATQKIIELAKNLNKDDLLITFICGGGSALACANQKELKGEIVATKELTKAGANIIELNTVRKHLSGIKGGGLAKLAYPATVVSLIVSDVLGNDLSMVASGPMIYDKTTKKDAEKILKKYNLLTYEVNRLLTETPKNREYFKKVKNILFLSNREPVLAMAEKAKKLGFKPKIYSLKLKGEARKALLPMIKKIKNGQVSIAGGETTVTLKKNQESGIRNYGKGGRNMESVLGALNFLPNSYFLIHNSIVISFASDGRDNTEAAGAIGDILTLKKAKKLKLNPQEFLDRHDSFNFFKKTGDLLFTKQKTFNVADFMIILKND